MATWLSWAETYANRSDPLNRFRDCNTEPITLYYFRYDKDRVAEEGFQEPDRIGYGTENPKSGIEWTNRPPRITAYERALTIELPKDLVLSHEWPEESDHYCRLFRVPCRRSR
jgi:hypothetical protein